MKHVQEIRIPAAKDYDAIKRAVYFHGGVQTSIYTDMTEEKRLSDYYEKSGSSYYYPTETEPNHDVVIMGWDDSYPRERFVTDPGMDGAFLCMNSWGTGFGESGLFYVSYADPNIGVHNLVYTGVEEADNYDRIYQDDLCGWLGQLGYEDETAWFSAVYEAGGEEQVAAVGFYATGPDTEYEIYQTEITEDGPVTGARLAQGSVLAGRILYGAAGERTEAFCRRAVFCGHKNPDAGGKASGSSGIRRQPDRTGRSGGSVGRRRLYQCGRTAVVQNRAAAEQCLPEDLYEQEINDEEP